MHRSADDLLSLFVYVLIASQTSGLYSQCRMLDEFIGDESALGEVILPFCLLYLIFGLLKNGTGRICGSYL